MLQGTFTITLVVFDPIMSLFSSVAPLVGRRHVCRAETDGVDPKAVGDAYSTIGEVCKD